MNRASRLPVPPTSSTSAIAAHEVVKSYGGTPALREVSFHAEAGEIVAITGPSGSGKSTLLLCLAGILTPEAGEVCFAGRRIDDTSEDARSRMRRTVFGVLFQFGQLVPELTAAENVALPLLLSGARRQGAVATARTGLKRVGVGDLAEVRPTHMSGGQAQRVAIARALATNPDVIFADEPTGALDSLAGEQVLTELTRAAKQDGTTVLLVTHEARVAAYADREVMLKDGQVDGAAPQPQYRPGR